MAGSKESPLSTLRQVGVGGGLREVEANDGGGGGRVGRSGSEAPLAGGFEGGVGEKLAGGWSFEGGGGDGAVGIDLHADVDANVAANGGASFGGNFGDDLIDDGEVGRRRRFCG